MSQPNLCPGSWQLTRNSSSLTSALTFISSPPMMKSSYPGSSLVMSAGFMVTTLLLARTDLAASPWQRPVSHFRLHPPVSGEKQDGCHPPPNIFPWFGTLWLLPISKNEIEAERTPVWYQWGDTGQIAESAWHSDRKGLPGSVPKMEEKVGPVSTCGRELLQGWQGPIGFIVSFTIFTASVQKILDTTS